MARAIRGALALTTVALAMSGSGQAFAAPGVCTPPVPPPNSTVDCEGVFPGPIIYAVEDLTVILGATDPTSEVNTVGTYAVSLTGTTGDETLVNYAAISTTGAYYAVTIGTTSGDISVTSSGTIYANSGGYSSITAIDAGSTDGAVAVDVLYGGDIVVYNASGTGTGVYAYSQTGTVDVTNDAAIYVSTNGNTYGIYAASDDGAVHVTNTGSIVAASDSDAYGIYAQSYANVYVDNSGTINASTTNGTAYGVFVYTCDCTALDATVTNTGSISAISTGGGDAYGIYIYAYDTGDATVHNNGSIYASSSNYVAAGV
jgi:hypothetical protein